MTVYNLYHFENINLIITARNLGRHEDGRNRDGLHRKMFKWVAHVESVHEDYCSIVANLIPGENTN